MYFKNNTTEILYAEITCLPGPRDAAGPLCRAATCGAEKWAYRATWVGTGKRVRYANKISIVLFLK
jgi:hypothetical protein